MALSTRKCLASDAKIAIACDDIAVLLVPYPDYFRIGNRLSLQDEALDATGATHAQNPRNACKILKLVGAGLIGGKC